LKEAEEKHKHRVSLSLWAAVIHLYDPNNHAQNPLFPYPAVTSAHAFMKSPHNKLNQYRGHVFHDTIDFFKLFSIFATIPGSSLP